MEAPFEYLQRIRQVGVEVFFREFETLGLADLHSSRQEAGLEMEDSASSL
jgi:hypothetical protein